MKNIEKYTVLLVFMIFADMGAQNQTVGIKAAGSSAAFSNSASLDINYTDKGILIPKYDLTVLTDSTNPVNFTSDIAAGRFVDGTIIFNTKASGTSNPNPKGYYIWVVDRWERAIISGTQPQQMALTIGAESPLVPANNGTTQNILTGFTQLANQIEGASSTANSITLPRGKYLYKYMVDCKNLKDSNGTYFPDSNTSTFQNIGYDIFAIGSYLIDGSGTAITETNYETKLSPSNLSSFTAFQGTFILSLTAATTLRQTFQYNTGNTNTTGLQTRSNFTVQVIRVGD